MPTNHIFTKNLFESLDLNYLNSETKSAAYFIKCSHHAHFKCLNNYLTANETNP